MKNKYYTPEIEEFHVGFEFEISMQSYAMSILDTSKKSFKQITPSIKSWEKTKVYFDESYGFKNKLFRSIEQLKEILEQNNIRVKYLDKEDLEELGFNFHDSEQNRGLNFKRGRYRLYFQPLNNSVIIGEEIPLEVDPIFVGKIKNKSELKKLLKQQGLDD